MPGLDWLFDTQTGILASFQSKKSLPILDDDDDRGSEEIQLLSQVLVWDPANLNMSKRLAKTNEIEQTIFRPTSLNCILSYLDNETRQSGPRSSTRVHTHIPFVLSLWDGRIRWVMIDGGWGERKKQLLGNGGPSQNFFLLALFWTLVLSTKSGEARKISRHSRRGILRHWWYLIIQMTGNKRRENLGVKTLSKPTEEPLRFMLSIDPMNLHHAYLVRDWVK